MPNPGNDGGTHPETPENIHWFNNPMPTNDLRDWKETTIGDMNKKYGLHFPENPRMKLSTWLRRRGFGNLANLFSSLK